MNFSKNSGPRPHHSRGGYVQHGLHVVRSQHGGSRGGSRGGRGGGHGSRGEHIDVSRFINKAVITEEVEHFTPEHAFADFAIDERLKQNIIVKGYTTPTPIQDKAIPHVLRSEDVVGIANTGTGKTAAFLIPLINKVLVAQTQGRGSKENMLIVVPTRELAIQIDAELKGFTGAPQSAMYGTLRKSGPGGLTDMKIFSVCVVGGAPIGPQIRDLRYHNNFVIGTPGRIKDLIERKVLNLALFNTVVLDEADRMLDMGFINDMKYFMSKMPAMPPKGLRHTLFFSATLSSDVEKLIKDFLYNPVRISVKTRDTAKSVDQDVVRIPHGAMKVDVLASLLRQPAFDKVLVFTRTKHGAEKLAKALETRGFKTESIHGDKVHSRRQRALTLFKESKVQVLVATDVAARGLDIAGVSHVINFEIPATYDDYVHRIGRTGRAGKKGKALTFVE
jgi:superfamily II DNA/RNA helicase